VVLVSGALVQWEKTLSVVGRVEVEGREFRRSQLQVVLEEQYFFEVRGTPTRPGGDGWWSLGGTGCSCQGSGTGASTFF